MGALPIDYMRLSNRTGFLPKIKETIWFNGVEAKHGPPFLRKVLDPFLASEQTCASLCLAWDQKYYNQSTRKFIDEFEKKSGRFSAFPVQWSHITRAQKEEYSATMYVNPIWRNVPESNMAYN